MVVGIPLGYGHSVARGILSATNRSLSMNNTDYEGLIQTDAAINPGNSGGPLVDLAGKLVGGRLRQNGLHAPSGAHPGIRFAIPARTVAEKVEQFKRDAQNGPTSKSNGGGSHPGHPAQLGLTLQALTADLSEAFGFPPGLAFSSPTWNREARRRGADSNGGSARIGWAATKSTVRRRWNRSCPRPNAARRWIAMRG